MPWPRRLGTTAIVSSGVSSSTKPKPGAAAGKSRYHAAPYACRPVGGDHARVARPAPVLDVAGDRQVRIAGRSASGTRGGACRGGSARPAGRRGGAPSRAPAASWIRLPSGSKTSSSRISPVSSRTMPTSTPASRSRSASALRSATSTCATPSFARLALREPDLHLAALELATSASSKSTAVSSKPSTSLVEAPARVEVADVVPDRRRHQESQRERRILDELPSPSAGSRRRRRRRRRDGRRSASSSSSGGSTTVAVDAATTLVVGRADGEDRRLRRVEHRDELLDAEHAEVRDRERAALEILRRAACSRARGRRGRRARPAISRERQPLDRADHRHDEPLRRGDGDADVRASGRRAARPRCTARSRRGGASAPARRPS